MQIKFLQTSTVLACFAGVIMAIVLKPRSASGMDYDKLGEAVRYGVRRAHEDLEDRERWQRQEQEKKREEEKEKRKREAFCSGFFPDTEEGREFKREYDNMQRKKAIENEKQEKIEAELKAAPEQMRVFNETLGGLCAEDRELWEEWDEERNWRQFFDLWEHGIYTTERNGTTYSTSNYYTKKEGERCGCKKDNIWKSIFAEVRCLDIQYFVEHKAKVPDEIREYKEFRLKKDADYKKDKRCHRELFPRNKKQKNIRRTPENVRGKTDNLRRELDKDPFSEEKRCTIS